MTSVLISAGRPSCLGREQLQIRKFKNEVENMLLDHVLVLFTENEAALR
jgi:hypothetical protein